MGDTTVIRNVVGAFQGMPLDHLGFPAPAMPCGSSEVGPPLSIQLVALSFEEARLSRAGHACQMLLDWRRRRPAV